MRAFTFKLFAGNRVRADPFNGDRMLAKQRALSSTDEAKAPSALSPIGDGSKLLIARLWSDRSGATLIEYTLLVSLVMLALLTLIIAMGGWANGMWVNLLAALSP